MSIHDAAHAPGGPGSRNGLPAAAHPHDSAEAPRPDAPTSPPMQAPGPQAPGRGENDIGEPGERGDEGGPGRPLETPDPVNPSNPQH